MERQYYLWSAGGATVSVAVAEQVIVGLRSAAQSTAEIGGILLGHRDSPEKITIEAYELLTSEHRRGVTFTLSLADRKNLENRLRARRGRVQIVGCFRSHLRQGLYMDQYDFELMSSHFGSSSDVMLIFRPTDWDAGFFVWEEGDIQRQKSYLEFPFDPDLLTLTSENPPQDVDAIPADTPTARLTARPKLPTLAKAGLIAATFGLVGVLAYYAHERHTPSVVTAAVQTPSARISQPPAAPINPPVDPDAVKPSAPENANDYELHVKLPVPDDRPSPFERRTHETRPDAVPPVDHVQTPPPVTATTPEPIPASPAPPEPVQTATISIPASASAEPMLKPARPSLSSDVSLEPSEPGLISRTIRHVPGLNLFQRHRYKAGDKFSPARPIREVKPKIPSAWESPSDTPSLVDVKVWIDKNGQVTRTELLSEGDQPELAELASNAAYKWTFQPARLADAPVSSEMIMHFRFVPKQNY